MRLVDRDSSSIRVLSARIDPPVTLLDGSTARTATRWPRAIRCRPSDSTKVDLPTPGAPLMPMRIDSTACGSSASSTACPRGWSSRRVDSISVIAFASARRSPARTLVTSAWSAAASGAGEDFALTPMTVRRSRTPRVRRKDALRGERSETRRCDAGEVEVAWTQRPAQCDVSSGLTPPAGYVPNGSPRRSAAQPS